MKTITMDFETYEYEKRNHQGFGAALGVGEVQDFISSGKKFRDWYCEHLCTTPQYAWLGILKALGREGEFDKIK